LISQEISRTAVKHLITIPIYWVGIDTTKNAKLKRLKSLNGIVNSQQVLFASGGYIEDLFNELENLGTGGSGRKRDDRGDVLSIGQRVLLPATTHTKPEDLEETKKLQQQQREQAIRRENYDRYFGNSFQPKPDPEPLEQQQPAAPRNDRFGRLPGGMR